MPSNKQMQRTKHGWNGASPLICVSPDTHRTEDAVTMRDKTDDVAGLSSVSPEGETHG